MIVIPTPSPFVPSPKSSSPAQKLCPLVTPKEVLGKGSFGIVFGPFSAVKMRQLLTQFYGCQECVQSLESVTGISKKTLSTILPESDSYVLKVMFSKSLHHNLELLDKKLQCFPLSMKRLFITPLIVGKFSFGHYEIQRYGGVDFFKVLQDKTQPWGTRDKLCKAIHSLCTLTESCFLLIEHAHLLITDVKPENMVYNEKTGEISLIDLEYITIDPQKSPKKHLVYSLAPHLEPIQFFNPNLFPDKFNRKLLIQKYIKMGGKSNQKYIVKEKVSFDELKKIAQFYILWVMVTNAYLIIDSKYKNQPVLVEKAINLWKKLNNGPRWRADFMDLLDDMKKLGETRFQVKALQ